MTSKQLLFSVFLLITTNAHAAVSFKAKMVAKEVPSGETSLFDKASRGIKRGSSHSAQFVKKCTPDAPAVFSLSSGEGLGTVIVVDDTVEGISISSDDGDVTFAPGSVQENAFGSLTYGADDGTVGTAFTYSGMPSEGGTAEVACENSVTLIVLLKDEHDFTAEYEINTTERVGGGALGLVQILDANLDTSLAAESMALGGDIDANGRRHLKHSDKVILHKATYNSVAHDSEGLNKDVVLVQVKTKSPDNKTIQRTIISPTIAAPPAVKSVELKSTEINGAGDVEFQFSSSLDPKDPLLLKTVVQVQSEGNNLSEEIVLKAMTLDLRLVLHGGWIRKLLNDAGAVKDWNLIISEAVALDPENGYAVVGHLSVPVDAQIEQRRHLLSLKPSEEELSVSTEMKEGRRTRVLPAFRSGTGISLDFDDSPDTNGIFEVREEGSDRNLVPLDYKGLGVYKGARILSHGYCSAPLQPFPGNQFKYSLEFEDNEENNWSNNRFAMEILEFSEENNLDGCSIIAHSQGGLASLTLKAFYESCLDTASFAGPGLSVADAKLIQSVGSPYQGTDLQGILASIGGVLGIGCGFQEDLTIEGAKKWLSEIPEEARAFVYYYRTADKNNSFCIFSSCSIATDPILTDPEDGVVEVSRGFLLGGNNMGVAYEQCHTTDMSYQGQCVNAARNRQMNLAAPV